MVFSYTFTHTQSGNLEHAVTILPGSKHAHTHRHTNSHTQSHTQKRRVSEAGCRAICRLRNGSEMKVKAAHRGRLSIVCRGRTSKTRVFLLELSQITVLLRFHSSNNGWHKLPCVDILISSTGVRFCCSASTQNFKKTNSQTFTSSLTD